MRVYSKKISTTKTKLAVSFSFSAHLGACSHSEPPLLLPISLHILLHMSGDAGWVAKKQSERKTRSWNPPGPLILQYDIFICQRLWVLVKVILKTSNFITLNYSRNFLSEFHWMQTFTLKFINFAPRFLSCKIGEVMFWCKLKVPGNFQRDSRQREKRNDINNTEKYTKKTILRNIHKHYWEIYKKQYWEIYINNTEKYT